MSAKPDQWMPLYVGDYLRDTTRLTTELHGAYLLLLMDYWVNGPPPDDDAVLATIARMPVKAWKLARQPLQGFFTVVDGRWRQKRADDELANARAITTERSEAGKRGAAKRWQNDGKANGKRMAEPLANDMANDMANAKQNDAPPPPPPQDIISVPDGTGGMPPFREPVVTPIDLQKAIWKQGLAFLAANGINERNGRGLIGRWLKAIGPPQPGAVLLDILASAEANAHGDVAAYVEKSLQNRAKSNGQQQKPTADERDRQRRADIFEGVASVFPGLRGADSGGSQGADPGSDPGRQIATVARST